jgi:hypothetical protein
MKKSSTFSRRAFHSALSLLALAAITSSAEAAPLTNGGFESGISNWLETGGTGLFSAPTALPGFYANVNPFEGSKFGLLSNNGVATETVSQTFDLTSNYLVFNYRFTSDELNTGPDYNDSATAVLTIGGNPTTLFTVSRDDLQAGGVGSLLPGASFLDTTSNGHDFGQSDWHAVAFNVSSFTGQSATLSFSVTNIGGSDLDIGVSQLAVDRVQLSSVPEPTASLLLISSAGVAVLLRRRRPRSHSA